MTDLEYLIDPKDHYLPYATSNYARDYSDGEVDAMTLEPLHESGLFCYSCNRAYGLSKLREPKIEDKSENPIID